MFYWLNTIKWSLIGVTTTKWVLNEVKWTVAVAGNWREKSGFLLIWQRMFINCVLRHRVFMGFTGYYAALWPGLVNFQRRLPTLKPSSLHPKVRMARNLFQPTTLSTCQTMWRPSILTTNCQFVNFLDLEGARVKLKVLAFARWMIYWFSSQCLFPLFLLLLRCAIFGSLCNECISPLPLLLKPQFRLFGTF